MTHVEIPLLRYLDEEGRPVADLPTWLDKALAHTFYRNMVAVRSYDKKAIALQRTGKLGTFPSHLGAEAVGIGVGLAMGEQDVYVPYYRDMPTLYVRGVGMEKNLQYWGGDERGSYFTKRDGTPSEDLPICVPIATQITHACGVASAFKLRGEPRVAVVTIGDGGTSKGDFLEGLNCAGVWHLPMVIIINNNQWAISVPRKLQSAAPTLAQKGIGAGVHSLQVDGNDVVAVYDAVKRALERARTGKGPTLIEAISYRLGDHTTADDATRYRDAQDVEAAWNKEPVKRLRQFMAERGWWNEEAEQALLAEAGAEVEQAVARYEALQAQPPEAMLDYHYAELPAELLPQRERIIAKAMRMEAGHE
ncbi:pyruvate dehydrogenase (acetyl-transferring) E1 component subunit alpha [Aeromonas schubertii]|uniref:Pyruvate dehydrogenase E1 component subunit alpha n=1 Tax=Aeromonas schubertii TaxID=652 RepID=A0A0S2SD68_9GAMM|nr:pyruvate dehydrogenase (acetyl-transferring) E1 component subunit alpha [Aeromonas schubertii]ALP39661.1 pyruvate dehydrogenase E1 component subunit alpha [Aeromonas schubertii]KUE81719.1 pyruvate dehydrogenase (acetyl-transferring) E1 component subunit alpha [Aeromonas schubertii]MBZ6065147.1 pyruvate dehydrogenase (acetyl-transferring) E1 component subunit alpha [Aeromonas schubertii]MBZ6071598.1 pyruvate dehydrogenase (acetyl-transferring) E1 component subunit alpha [Aeromonas schubertii]